MNRARKSLIQDGSVNLVQERGGFLTFYPDHNAVRVEEIANGASLAQELGVRCQLTSQPVAGVDL